MFAALNELLGVSVEQPERSQLTLLCATKTDAGFLVHHFLSFYLRAGCKVCFLALAQSFSHYSFVAQKLGVNLLTAKEQNQLIFFEGLKWANQVLFSDGQESEDPNPFQFISGDGSDLKGLYEFVRTAVNPPTGGHRWKFSVLIVDDLGVLLSLGVRLVDLLNFVHYCRVTVNAELKGNLVFMVHSREDSEDEENETLVKALRHHASRLLWAEGLATGPCQEVHGQLTILEKDSRESGAARDLQRVYQYKILDRNVAFFARGMSAAVL
ncbi:elongator complex protein 6 [Protobothrops mucrosquamatus]|uniref:elongator complex protein 6 n=1 Tax=Protobothrops mucrosquamatus TaxID=103944 RepID=UPI0007757357|nr:elongator complex protein 6 [Protobothrops mucrosquamatus]